MKKFSAIAAMFLAGHFTWTAPAAAQQECIENAAGELLCGRDAEAEKERIREALLERKGAKSQYDEPAPRARAGSVYSGFSKRAFVRGGTAFSGGGSEFADNITGSVGAGFDLGQRGFSVETELYLLRDSETISDPFFGTITAKALGLAGLLSLRYDIDTGSPLTPFASVGVGPGYFRATVDDGVTSISDDDFTFVYSGRAGLALGVSDRLGVEAAYRYLDTTQDGFAGQHSVEVGLNLGF